MTYRGGTAMSGLSIIAAVVVLAAVLGIIGWYGGWFGGQPQQSVPAPPAAGQGASQQSPSSSQQQ